MTGNLVVSNQVIPVVGVVVKDVIQDDNVAIPEGSKVFGDISFDESSEKTSITWRAIKLSDGRDRQISAVSVGSDGQSSIKGHIHSEALKNTIGETLTRFIGAYAEGSMQRGQMGASTGGSENGIKSAIAETAKDRANKMAEDMKKENKWIEIESGTECVAIINQAFRFRDAGETHER